MTQHDRILIWLKERGHHGVHSFELVEAHMPRGAAIVKVLRDEGYEIDSVREPYLGKSKGVRYILRTSPVISRGPSPDSEPQQLVSTGAPFSGGQYDPYSEWA